MGGQERADVDVSIIVASYNTRDVLAENLASIYALSPRCSFEVIVADDASKDGSAQMVRERFPQAVVVEIPVNGGYSRTNNLGIAASRGRYVHLLNSDVRVLPGMLDTLVDFLEAHPKAGAAGSLIYNEDGSIQAAAKALPSLRTAFVGKRSWLYRLFPKSSLARGEVLTGGLDPHAEPFRAGYVSSASVMIPRAVIDAIGPLDETLFYWGDADHCKRIWDTGREVWCVPGAQIVHFEHRGGTTSSWRRRFWSIGRFHRDAWRYYRKHSGRPTLHPVNLGVGAALFARGAAITVLRLGKELLGWEDRH